MRSEFPAEEGLLSIAVEANSPSCPRDSKIIFNFVCPFSRAKTLFPVKAVIKAAYLKEKLP